MQNSKKQVYTKGEPYNYSNDFKVLSVAEKWGILKIAKTLLKVQRETALHTGVLSYSPPLRAVNTVRRFMMKGKFSVMLGALFLGAALFLAFTGCAGWPKSDDSRTSDGRGNLIVQNQSGVELAFYVDKAYKKPQNREIGSPSMSIMRNRQVR